MNERANKINCIANANKSTYIFIINSGSKIDQKNFHPPIIASYPMQIMILFSNTILDVF